MDGTDGLAGQQHLIDPLIYTFCQTGSIDFSDSVYSSKRVRNEKSENGPSIIRNLPFVAKNIGLTSRRTTSVNQLVAFVASLIVIKVPGYNLTDQIVACYLLFWQRFLRANLYRKRRILPAASCGLYCVRPL